MPSMPERGRLLLLRAYKEYTGAAVSCREPKERRDACKVGVEHVSVCVSVSVTECVCECE